MYYQPGRCDYFAPINIRLAAGPDGQAENGVKTAAVPRAAIATVNGI
jgi:hypothetical protein